MNHNDIQMTLENNDEHEISDALTTLESIFKVLAYRKGITEEKSMIYAKAGLDAVCFIKSKIGMGLNG